MTLTERMVEAAARALRDNNADELGLPLPGRWEDTGAEFQEYWRKRARAALTTALALAEANGAVLCVVPEAELATLRAELAAAREALDF